MKPERVNSIDVLRGVVMILMVIDHVRVFAGVPAGGATYGLFFTRWVTHFCAPVFVFLAGTSAYLHGRDRGAAYASRFLAIRGLWLIVLELTFLRLAWTFNVDYAHYLLAGVIWCIGWSMVILALLVWLPTVAVGAIGVVVAAGHNVFDSRFFEWSRSLTEGSFGWFWKLAYFGFFAPPIRIGESGPHLVVLYSIVPWVGVMAAGYAFGAVARMEPQRRHRICLGIGIALTLAFLVLRGFDLYGDPRPWRVADGAAPGVVRRGPALPPLLAFLNTSKYPGSLSFLLMTLGPTLMLVPLADRARGALARFVTVFGRVPMFFYLLHIPLIHALALIVSKVRSGAVSPWLFENHPMGASQPPADYVWSLPLLYLVSAITVAIAFVACRWFAGVKARNRSAWLSYV